MKISVIIPSLGKRPKELAEAVASVKAQTMPAHEILVVDYTDDSYGNQARRINEGVKKSTGDAYVFMGDDDQLMPTFIERMSAELESNPYLDIVTSGFQNFGDNEEINYPERFPLCSTVVRRSIYDKTQGYDERIPIGIDSDFYFQCFEAGAHWKIIPDVLFRSRVHKDQYSHTGDWTNYKPLIHEKYNGKYDNV